MATLQHACSVIQVPVTVPSTAPKTWTGLFCFRTACCIIIQLSHCVQWCKLPSSDLAAGPCPWHKQQPPGTSQLCFTYSKGGMTYSERTCNLPQRLSFRRPRLCFKYSESLGLALQLLQTISCIAGRNDHLVKHPGFIVCWASELSDQPCKLFINLPAQEA